MSDKIKDSYEQIKSLELNQDKYKSTIITQDESEEDKK